MLTAIGVIVSLTIVVVIAARVTITYSNTEGTTGQRVWIAARQSATWMWLGFSAFITQVSNLVLQAMVAVGLPPQVETAINSYFTPTNAAIVIAIITVGGMIARARTL